MAEAIMYTEIQRTTANAMNQNDLSESAQPQPSDSSSNYLQQQQQGDDDMTIDITEMFPHYEGDLLLSDCCIYRVPIAIRDRNKEAYTPKIVSIGPFHYGNKRLRHMERLKQMLFKGFTQRFMSSWTDLVRCVKRLEPNVRASYLGTIKFTEQELVKLTLMDAGFIIELFIMSSATRNDLELSQPKLWESIREDLLLLENQLPFFVIEELFNEAIRHGNDDNYPSFLRLTFEYFKYYNKQKLELTILVDEKIKHFTDLLRWFYTQGKKFRARSRLENGSRILIHNAKLLQEIGIKFGVKKDACLLDLEISRRSLEIPGIVVDGNTELLFRNMIALEQCHYPDDAYITDYALLMDCLVESNEDVNFLIDKKIICNHLVHTKKVASLFRGLLENVTPRRFDSGYLDKCKRLNDCCQVFGLKQFVFLVRTLFPTEEKKYRWHLSIVLFYLAVIQTVFSILQVTTIDKK